MKKWRKSRIEKRTGYAGRILTLSILDKSVKINDEFLEKLRAKFPTGNWWNWKLPVARKINIKRKINSKRTNISSLTDFALRVAKEMNEIGVKEFDIKLLKKCIKISYYNSVSRTGLYRYNRISFSFIAGLKAYKVSAFFLDAIDDYGHLRIGQPFLIEICPFCSKILPQELEGQLWRYARSTESVCSCGQIKETEIYSKIN